MIRSLSARCAASCSQKNGELIHRSPQKTIQRAQVEKLHICIPGCETSFPGAELVVTNRSQGLPDGIFKNQKIPIWLNFGESCNGRCWYILWPIGLFYCHLVYIVAIWYILRIFGIFLRFWYVVPRKIRQPWCRRERLLIFESSAFHLKMDLVWQSVLASKETQRKNN
jgi:hypothetical protein